MGHPEGRTTWGGEGRQGEADSAKARHHSQGLIEGGQGSRRQQRAAGRWGKVGKVRTVPGSGTDGGRGRGKVQGGWSTKDRGRQGSQEQEARDMGRWLDEGVWGHWCTRAQGGGRRWGRVIPPFPPPPYPPVVPVYWPPSMYPGALLPAPMQQHPLAVRVTWGAPGEKGEELRRASEGVGEVEGRLREMEARVMGEAAGAARAQASAQGTPGGREAHTVEGLQRACADVRRRAGRPGRAERNGKRQGDRAQRSGGTEICSPLQPLTQLGIPPEAELEVQERAWKRIRGKAAGLEERAEKWRSRNAG